MQKDIVMNMIFETKSKDLGDPLIEIIENSETKTQPSLGRTETQNTSTYAEDTSAIDLSVQRLGVVVYIRPFEDGEKLKKLLERGKDRKTYLFKGIASADLRRLFCDATRKICKCPFIEILKDVFQVNYRKVLKRELYDAVENLSRNYKD